MFNLLSHAWNSILTGGSFIAGFITLVILIAAAVFPILAAVGFFFLWREYRRERYGEAPLDGVLVADAYHYAPTHTWIGGRAFGGFKIGVDDIGRRIVSGVSRVVLPKTGTYLKEGDPAVTICCRGGREITLPAPASGLVTAANDVISREPAMLETAPYTKGWLFAMKPVGEGWQKLPTGNGARSWFTGEEHRFASFIEHQFGLAAADGGRFMVPPQDLLDDVKWRELADEFLVTR